MEDWIVSIRITGNTFNPCLLALRAKGYHLTSWYNLNGEYRHNWDAEKDGRSFSATSPQELLGLVAMWEMRGDDWQKKSHEPNVFEELDAASITYNNDGNVVDEE